MSLRPVPSPQPRLGLRLRYALYVASGVLAAALLALPFMLPEHPPEPDERVRIRKTPYPVDLVLASSSYAAELEQAQRQLEQLKRSKQEGAAGRRRQRLLVQKIRVYRRMEDHEFRMRLHLDDTSFELDRHRKRLNELKHQLLELEDDFRRMKGE